MWYQSHHPFDNNHDYYIGKYDIGDRNNAIR